MRDSDQAMYQAKRKGRARTSCSRDDEQAVRQSRRSTERSTQPGNQQAEDQTTINQQAVDQDSAVDRPTAKNQDNDPGADGSTRRGGDHLEAIASRWQGSEAIAIRPAERADESQGE